MTRWRLTIEYDGGPFMGWQRQDHGPSVQQALEEALERMTGQKSAFTAAGRTDAGVHALALFELRTRLRPSSGSAESLCFGEQCLRRCWIFGARGRRKETDGEC